MTLTLKEWLLNGLGNDASRSAFVQALAIAAEPSPKQDDADHHGSTSGTGRASATEPTLQVVPLLPIAMMDHFPSVLAKWPAAADALAATAEPYDNLVMAVLAAAALNKSPTHPGDAKYWQTLMLAVQTIAARLHLPVTTADGNSEFGTTLTLRAGTGNECFAIILVVSDDDFGRLAGEPASTGGCGAPQDVLVDSQAGNSAFANARKLQEEMTTMMFVNGVHLGLLASDCRSRVIFRDLSSEDNVASLQASGFRIESAGSPSQSNGVTVAASDGLKGAISHPATEDNSQIGHPGDTTPRQSAKHHISSDLARLPPFPLRFVHYSQAMSLGSNIRPVLALVLYMALAKATNSMVDLHLPQAPASSGPADTSDACVHRGDVPNCVPDDPARSLQGDDEVEQPRRSTSGNRLGQRRQTLDLYEYIDVSYLRKDHHLHRVPSPPLLLDRNMTVQRTWSADPCGCDRCKIAESAVAARYRCAALPDSLKLGGTGSNPVVRPCLANDNAGAHGGASDLELPPALFLHGRIGSGHVGSCFRATADRNRTCPKTLAAENIDGGQHKCCSCCRQQYVVKFAIEGKAAALASEAACYELLQATAGTHQRSWPRFYGRFQGPCVDVIVIEYTGTALDSFSELSKDERIYLYRQAERINHFGLCHGSLSPRNITRRPPACESCQRAIMPATEAASEALNNRDDEQVAHDSSATNDNKTSESAENTGGDKEGDVDKDDAASHKPGGDDVEMSGTDKPDTVPPPAVAPNQDVEMPDAVGGITERNDKGKTESPDDTAPDTKASDVGTSATNASNVDSGGPCAACRLVHPTDLVPSREHAARGELVIIDLSSTRLHTHLVCPGGDDCGELERLRERLELTEEEAAPRGGLPSNWVTALTPYHAPWLE